MLAARWQHVDIDQISPTNDAISFAGTFCLLIAIADLSFVIAAWIFCSRDGATLKVKDRRSTIVPSALIAFLGKKEHFSIRRYSPSAADSYTI